MRVIDDENCVAIVVASGNCFGIISVGADKVGVGDWGSTVLILNVDRQTLGVHIICVGYIICSSPP